MNSVKGLERPWALTVVRTPLSSVAKAYFVSTRQNEIGPRRPISPPNKFVNKNEFSAEVCCASICALVCVCGEGKGVGVGRIAERIVLPTVTNGLPILCAL